MALRFEERYIKTNHARVEDFYLGVALENVGVALRKFRSSNTRIKYAQGTILKLVIQQYRGTALRILGVAPKVGEEGVALRVGEKSAS